MKTLGILFSARKGNGYDIAQYLLPQEDILLLADCHLLPCSRCNYECMKKMLCPIKDDLVKIYKKLKDYDRWLIITPTYDGHPPSFWYILEERLPAVWYRKEKGFEDFYKTKSVFLITIGNSEGDLTERIIQAHFTERGATIAATLLIKPSDYPLGGGIEGGLIQNLFLLSKLEPVQQWIGE